MKLLLDTHIVLWAVSQSHRLTPEGRALLGDAENALLFSPVSIWEAAIKFGLGRSDFQVDPHVLRRALLDNDYEELSIRGEHAAALADLPFIHKDPFDRMLIAQAVIEGVTLVTSDPVIACYPGPIRKI